MSAALLPICADWVSADAVAEDTGVRAKKPEPVVPAFGEAPVCGNVSRPVKVDVVSILEHLREGQREGWPQPCRDAFTALADDDPSRLAAWIASGDLSRAHLSHAAEALGAGTEGATTPALIQILLRLLEHESPLVREGSVYGLAFHMGSRVRSILGRVAKSDPSPGVRAAAAEVLDED